ncbi:MAG: NAD(P)H-hydrate dehydratase, partial [Planctomycetota bacterium]
GMATGGAGDCLTGVIAALVAQSLSPWEAARLGVHVHGAAGDQAAAQLGQVSLIATDIAANLPEAIRQLDP